MAAASKVKRRPSNNRMIGKKWAYLGLGDSRWAIRLRHNAWRLEQAKSTLGAGMWGCGDVVVRELDEESFENVHHSGPWLKLNVDTRANGSESLLADSVICQYRGTQISTLKIKHRC